MSDEIPRGVRLADGTIEFDGNPFLARYVKFDGRECQVLGFQSSEPVRGVRLNYVTLFPGGTFNYSVKPRDDVTPDALAPCPFCGSRGRPYVATHLHDGRISQAYVSCDECSADGPSEDSVAAAVERWNTRRIPRKNHWVGQST